MSPPLPSTPQGGAGRSVHTLGFRGAEAGQGRVPAGAPALRQQLSLQGHEGSKRRAILWGQSWTIPREGMNSKGHLAVSVPPRLCRAA